MSRELPSGKDEAAEPRGGFASASALCRRGDLRASLLLFCLLNAGLYLFLACFHDRLPFNRSNYLYGAYHYFQDDRITGGGFALSRGLAFWDAQFYLRIAEKGYGVGPQESSAQYAFFPLFPLLLRLVAWATRDVAVGAFVFANALLVANFASIAYVVSRIFDRPTALRSAFLVLLFPVAAFYRAYYTEGLFLLLSTWYLHFLIRRRWWPTALFASLLCVTRPSGLFVLIPMVWAWIEGLRSRELSPIKAVGVVLTSGAPLGVWLAFNALTAGDPLHFVHVQAAWDIHPKGAAPSFVALENLRTIFRFPSLLANDTHASKIDVGTLFVVASLLFLSRRALRRELWWLGFGLALGPLLVTDFMSYRRFQVVQLPLFVYLAAKLDGVFFDTVFTVFTVGLALTSLLLVNWYWVG